MNLLNGDYLMEGGGKEQEVFTTIADILYSVFPSGTRGEIDTGETEPWETIPDLPYDVFAFCAHLIDLTGLMGFFDPDPKGSSEFKPNEPLKITLSESARIALKESSDYWKKNNGPDESTMELWSTVYELKDFAIRTSAYQKEHKNQGKKQRCPVWWKAVFSLLIIADEASAEVGHFDFTDYEKQPAFSKLNSVRLHQSRKGEQKEQTQIGNLKVRKADNYLSSLTVYADKSIVAVQPKGRVSNVGCSLRNLSRNLALVGPTGSVRCSWQQLAGPARDDNGQGLDILLVPLPFELAAKDFSPTRKPITTGWGAFAINQSWLNDKDAVIKLTKKLINSALKDVETLNGIIFPEYALNWEIFSELTEVVSKETNNSIEFMIAGSSSNCDNDEANCVLTAIWEQEPAGKTEKNKVKEMQPVVRIVSQKKTPQMEIGKKSNFYICSWFISNSKN